MLKNYTSTVPASRSITSIEKCLVSHGAKHIAKTYTDGATSGIKFVMEVGGKDTIFSLPAKIKNCQNILEENTTSRTRPETMAKIPAQAERTAWKIVLDWIKIQMAMIDLAQIEMLEVFLPYAYNAQTDQTFFEQIKQNDYKALLPEPNRSGA